MGFAITLNDIGELVESYVVVKDHKRSQNLLNYKEQPGFVGPDRVSLFLKGRGFSLKEATNLSAAQYNGANNPFVVYHFYEVIDKTMEKLGVEDRPGQLWNCDESGLSHEPKKCKVVSLKNQKTLQVKPLRYVVSAP